jgi:hypothetical protein
MFDSKTKFTGRLTDAVDLLIDFATLGEYGFEPVGRTTPSCETRHRRPAPARASRRPRAGATPRQRAGAPVQSPSPRTRPVASTPSKSPRRHPVTGPFLLRP